MPFRKAYRKFRKTRKSIRRNFKRRTFRRRRGSKLSLTRVKTRWASDATNIKFYTSNTFRLVTDTTIGYDIASMRGNDLSDPFGTESGSIQPTGLDQWGYFYRDYYVAGCKITVEIQNLTAATAPRCVLVPTCAAALTGANDWDPNSFKPEENPHAQHRMVNSSGGGRPLYMKGYMSTNKIFGRKGTIVEDAFHGQLPLQGSGATSPATNYVWYWNIALLNRDLAATSVTAVCLVKMTYYCRLRTRFDTMPVSQQ